MRTSQTACMRTPCSWLGGSEDPWDSSSLQTKDPTCCRCSPAKWGKLPPANKEHLDPWRPPVTRSVPKQANPAGPECTRPPVGGTVPALGGRQRSQGAPELAQARPREPSIPGGGCAPESGLARGPRPAGLPPRPGSMATRDRGLAAPARRGRRPGRPRMPGLRLWPARLSSPYVGPLPDPSPCSRRPPPAAAPRRRERGE